MCACVHVHVHVHVHVYVCARARARERGNEVSRREKESVTRSFVGNVGRYCPVRHKFPNRWEMHFSAAHRAVVVRVQVVRRLHRAVTGYSSSGDTGGRGPCSLFYTALCTFNRAIRP